MNDTFVADRLVADRLRAFVAQNRGVERGWTLWLVLADSHRLFADMSLCDPKRVRLHHLTAGPSLLV
jgi:hypothetical protein